MTSTINNYYDFLNIALVFCVDFSANKISDVFGDLKPEGDNPDSLISKPDPTPKTRTRTHPDPKLLLP